jgi:hypothetical protein
MSRRIAACRVFVITALMSVSCLAGAAAASAFTAPVGSWRFDEGRGTLTRDSGAFHLDGVLPASGVSWIAGVQGTALRFAAQSGVALPDGAALEPDAITVAAWVRRAGSPGAYRYMFSKGSSTCLRSAYGLYTGRDGGAAFYVAGDGLYTVSPEIPAAAVWDGRWHRVAGTYDGSRVRMYLDGVRVAHGIGAPTHIEYGLSSRAPFIGTYRGDCELPFAGDLDNVAVWSTALTRADIAQDAVPPATTPTTGPIGHAPGAPRPGSPSLPVPGGYTITPDRCTSLRLNRRNVRAARRTKVVVTVRRGTKRLRGARVLMRSGKLRKSARTNTSGRARFFVRAKRSHRRLTVRVVTTKRAACGTPVAYIRVVRRR